MYYVHKKIHTQTNLKFLVIILIPSRFTLTKQNKIPWTPQIFKNRGKLHYDIRRFHLIQEARINSREIQMKIAKLRFKLGEML